MVNGHQPDCPRSWPIPAAGCWCGRNLSEGLPDGDHDDGPTPPLLAVATARSARSALKGRARELRLGGATIREIAELLGVGMTTASTWLKDAEGA
jgi:hypothetical protein